MVNTSLSAPRTTEVGQGIGSPALLDLALITLMWAIASTIANPIGEFPLIDDFSYSRAAQILVETGDYRPLGWAVMSLFTHVLWGGLFCLPFGFSFTALRISTVVAGLLGLYGTYVLARDQQLPRGFALTATLGLASFPPYFALSHTFMTDIPFMAAAIWSAVFFSRALRNGTHTDLAIGTALAIVATLARQVGLAMPLAFFATLLLRPPLNSRVLIRAVLPLVITIASLLLYNHWLEVTGRAPVQYTQLSETPLKHTPTLLDVVHHLAIYCVYVPLYLGLFLLPVFLIWPRQMLWNDSLREVLRQRRLLVVGLFGSGVVVTLAAASMLVSFGSVPFLPFPSPGNMLGNSGVGPPSFRDLIMLDLWEHVGSLPAFFWIGATLLGVVGAVLLLFTTSIGGADMIAKTLKRSTRTDAESVALFLALCCAAYLPPFISYGFFDRYLILLVPFIAIALATLHWSGGRVEKHKGTLAAGLSLLIAASLISTLGTRDYLTWNRIRWQALNDLTQRGISPAEIDGGIEFNGWHFYDPNYRIDPSKSSWWVQDDVYVIGFGPIPGYTVTNEYSYWHWFPPHEQKLVVMRKD